MKKRILAIGLTLAMLSSGSMIVLADDEAATTGVENEEIVSVLENKSDISEEVITIDKKGFEAEDGALLYANDGSKISKDDIKAGSIVTVYKRDSKMLAAVLMKDDAIAGVDLDVYTKSDIFGDLINAKNDLALHLDADIDITDTDGNKVEKDKLEGKILLVFCTQVAMSIPGQTTPDKIIVIGDAAKDDEKTNDKADEKAVEYVVAAKDVIKEDDVTMLPLRLVSEGLGYEVGWNDNLKRITIGTVQMGVNFTLGENKYYKSKMTPFVLEKAPQMQIFGDYGVTYVPASFFTDVLLAEVSENTDGSVSVKL